MEASKAARNQAAQRERRLDDRARRKHQRARKRGAARWVEAPVREVSCHTCGATVPESVIAHAGSDTVCGDCADLVLDRETHAADLRTDASLLGAVLLVGAAAAYYAATNPGGWIYTGFDSWFSAAIGLTALAVTAVAASRLRHSHRRRALAEEGVAVPAPLWSWALQVAALVAGIGVIGASLLF